ncbi:DUF4132 domain-containing protein [Amycolatopsis magusensis]|uniref:DUF4132 domain-containing protein n=1 Tax=Amycolatopsis magusensis TaxID=882444 RepID=UPI0037B88634
MHLTDHHPTSPATTENPVHSEEILVHPPHWLRLIHPRRGGAQGPPLHPGRRALAELEPLLPHFRGAVDHHLGEPAPAKAALAFLGGEPTPLGAAALAAMAAVKLGPAPKKAAAERFSALADVWLLDHGYAFAAEAACCLPLLSAGWESISFHVREHTPEPLSSGLLADPLLYRLRAHLAEASEVDYQAAVAALSRQRHTLGQRRIAAFLAPGETAWVDAFVPEALDLGHRAPAETLLCMLGTGPQLEAVRDTDALAWALRNPRVIPTLVDGVGVDAVPALAEWATYYGAEPAKRIADALAALPADEAFESLLDLADQRPAREALPAAMRRFPVRALRVLARRCPGSSRPARFAARLLTARVLTDPEGVDAALPALDPQARAMIETIRADHRPLPEAPAEALPRLLTAPPWTRPRALTERVILDDLEPGDPLVAWAPGEREAWCAEKTWAFRQPDALPKAIEQLRSGVLDAHLTGQLLAHGPEDVGQELLARWYPTDLWFAESWLPPALARYELDALPLALHVARMTPQATGIFLLPFTSPEVAELMADWLARLKGSAREVAMNWLARHRSTAARLLIPLALGEPGRLRSAAEAALLTLDPSTVDEAARAHGREATAAIGKLLATDPLDVLPARIPDLPDWAEPAALPQILLRDGKFALPASSVRHFLTMLAMSRPDEPYAGVRQVVDFADPASLARFGWELFEAWQAAGAPSSHGWPLTALGWLGDDKVARELARVIRAWPGEGGHSRAVLGLDVLAALGTGTALMHLHAISRKVKFRALKLRAADKILEVATGLGLTIDQLADRLVPDFGLSADGKLRLDYGPRQFFVGFDEQLKPFVTDVNGKRRRELPKPGVRDDPELAPAARERFATLKKDVRTVAGDQVRRLEQAMIHCRKWTVEEFRLLFVDHPLLWHIGRRLVWLAESEGTRAFRIAEDRTFADLEDNQLTLAERDAVRIAHPLHLGESVAAWAEVFADYEILQPFRQLGREVHKLTADERAKSRLDRFSDRTVPAGKLFGLARYGWERPVPRDNGVQPWLFRSLHGTRAVVISLDPGIVAGQLDEFPEQRITAVWLTDCQGGERYPRETGLRFGDLDPVLTSEVLAELTELVEPVR